MIITPSSERSQLLPQAPPFAKRRGLRIWFANVRAGWHGRRDKDQPFDGHGLTPFTYALHYHADQIVSLVDDALRAALDPIDQRCAQLSRSASAAPDDGEKAVAQTASPLPAEPGSLLVDEAARRDRLERAAAERVRVQRATEYGQAIDELERLERHRADLCQAARDLADSYSARCDELVQHHLRGYRAAHAADRIHSRHELDLPRRHVSNYDWSDPGDRTVNQAKSR